VALIWFAVALNAAPWAIPLAPAAAAECVGDECEAPPPAPEDQTPGTATVEGPGNPAVHWPTPHHKKHHHRRHHHRSGHR